MKLNRGIYYCFALLLFACNQKKGDTPTDSYKQGTIHISCDESFKPVIDQQVAVYESSYPNTHIIVDYKPEAECIKDFGVDSIQMIIATRGYSAGERKIILDSAKAAPDQLTIAHDLIAVIVNPAAKDSFFSMQEIKDLLTGKLKEKLIPVFDGSKATSTVRFMLDSVLRNQNFSANVVAAKNSVDVIDYVSRVPNAVGFIGFSWIGNNEDSAQMNFRNKVKTAYLESTDSAGFYVKPSQYLIYTNSYPLVRDLIYVLKDNHQGLAYSFARFLAGERGQLVFRRAYLMPVLLPNFVRDARLKETLTRGK